MLRTFLDNNNANNLIRDLRNRNKPTVFCFYGTEKTGKTIIARHFYRLFPDICVLYDFEAVAENYGENLVSRNIQYIIVECTRKPARVKNWAQKYGYQYREYNFKGKPP